MTTDPAKLDFLVRIKRIDAAKLTVRDILVLWAIQAKPGMTGRELATQLAYPTRSNVQENVKKALALGYIEDRRKTFDHKTPCDLHMLPAGDRFLADIIPA